MNTVQTESFAYSQDQLAELAHDLLKHAEHLGASACEVDFSEGFGRSVSVRRSELESIEYNRDKGVGVTVYHGQRRGHASSSDFSPAALRATVEAAASIARLTAPDEAAGLPEAERLWQPDAALVRTLDLFHPWELDTTAATLLAQRCEQAAFDADAAISNSDGASVYTQQSQFMSANSLGFCAGFATSRHSLSAGVIAGTGEAMQTGDWYTCTRNAQELDSPESVGAMAARRAAARLGSRRIATCEVPVIFEAQQACGLLAQFVHAVSGGSLYRRASFLLDSLGKPVFAPHVQIDELPHLPRALASTPFDDEGVATKARRVVADGRLEGYFLGSYSARKLGMSTTGNAGGCHNLVLAPGKDDLPALIRQVGRGLLVTELLGQGLNYVTGDYSRGAAGFWIENGEIAYPVHEITIAGNLRDMLLGIGAIGADSLVRGGRQCPSLVIERMTIAGL